MDSSSEEPVTPRASWRLSGPQLRDWLGGLLGDGYSVVALVEQEGVRLFRAIKSPEQAILSPSGKSRWSPKEFLFPRSETLHSYTFAEGGVAVTDPPLSEKRQVLLGVRCCDAAGLARLDATLLSGEIDALYAHRRTQTTVVSVACAAADPECFCTAVGGSPVGEDGSDLLLVPLGETWLARVLSEKGAALVAPTTDQWSAPSPEDQARTQELERQVADLIQRSPALREWSPLLEQGFEDPAWERFAQHCLGCGICAYVCPSCACFDMHHEADAWCGKQCRSWDSCGFALFTRHASGHNPRSTQAERFRHRVLHKFAYRSEDDDSFRCVGCGRCVVLCPAGLDILETASAAVTAIRERNQDAAG